MKFRIENLERRDLLTSTLVADINQLASQSSNPRDFTSAAGTTFFVANSEVGAELWKTDGTTEGTTIIRDIVPGADGSNPYELIPFSDLLLFHSNDQVWRTDGTDVGTFPLDGMTRIIAANSTRAISENGFITDGTVEGTSMLEGLRQAAIEETTAVTEEFFYLEYRSRAYRVDMSGMDERLISVGRADIFSLNGEVFSAERVLAAFGTAAIHVRPVDESNEGFFIAGELLDAGAFLDVDGIGYFETINESRETSLWRTDGTGIGTFVVAQFAENVSESNGFAPTVLDSAVPGNDPGEIWFVADGRLGEEIWKSDGTVNGTGVVRDVFRGRLGSAPSDLVVDGDTLWFVANDGVSGRQIWRTDGTNDGTVRVTLTRQQLFDFSEGPTILGVSPERVYFRTLSDDGMELWVTDGTTASTRQLKDIMPGASGSFPSDLIVNPDGSAFFAATSLDGSELWRTDGTEAGTVLVEDIHDSDETKSSNPNNFIAFNDKLYFVANDGIHGAELWSYDGTTTSMVHDIWSGPKSSSPKELTVVGDSLFFVADDEDSGRELYRLNRFGVTLVHDISVADAGSNPEQLVALDGRLYFVADIDESSASEVRLDLASRRGLWSTNGSELKLEVQTAEGGTRNAAGAVFDLTKFDGSLYFYELKDTERDNLLVHRLTPGDDGATDEIINATSVRTLRDFYAIQATSEFLIFAGQVEEARRDAGLLLVQAGAELGAAPVALEWDDAFTDADTLTTVGNEIYLNGRRSFLFNGEVDGAVRLRLELPITESLIVGETNFLVRDGGTIAHLLTGELRTNRFSTVARFPLRSGIRSGLPTELTDWNDKLYFVANDLDSEHGTQIWSVNDEQDDVVMETTLGPERIGSQASSLFVFKDELYFSADDGVSGRELWKLEASTELGDVNKDGTLGTSDIDALFAATQSGESRPELDLDDDADVDTDDVTYLVENVLETQFGDTNLDGDIDFTDFLALAQGFLNQDGDWASGDLDGDRKVTFEDYLILAENYI